MRTGIGQCNAPYQQGLTLVELMIALVVSLLLLAGVIQIFLGAHQSYRMDNGLSRVQNNGRYAVHRLQHDLRMAGYQTGGCGIASSRYVSTLKNGQVPADMQQGPDALPIAGWEAANTDAASTTQSKPYQLSASPSTAALDGGDWRSTAGISPPSGIKPIVGTDVVRVRAAAQDIETISLSNGANTVLTVPRNSGFKDGDILTVDDCSGNAFIVQACNVQDTQSKGSSSTNLVLSAGCTPGNDVPQRFNDLQTPAYVGRAPTVAYYYLADDSHDEPTLYRNDGSQAEALVRGVEDMQIRYGEDTDGDGAINTYVTADQVNNWNNVLSVRIALLLASSDGVRSHTESNTFDLGGTWVKTPDDRQLRHTFVTTIALRNRMK